MGYVGTYGYTFTSQPERSKLLPLPSAIAQNLTYSSIVEEGIGSGIILEDNADWDVNIKTQLQSFALAVRALQGTTNTKTFSPYGDDWDILWLGHCGLECKTDLPYYQSANDPTVPEPRHFLPYGREPPAIDRPDYSRMTCTPRRRLFRLLRRKLSWRTKDPRCPIGKPIRPCRRS